MATWLKRWFEGLKTATVEPTVLETYVQDRLIGVRERIALEHEAFNNNQQDYTQADAGGRHKKGQCSVCYYGTYASFPTGTAGSIAYATDQNKFYYHNGSAWVAQTLNSVPVGAIFMWATNSPPTGYFICNGAAYNTSTYASLYSAIGSVYGSNLPDFRLRFPLGTNNGSYPLGGTGGSTPVLTHAHGIGNATYGTSGMGGFPFVTFATGTGTGNGGGTVPYITINFIIKY